MGTARLTPSGLPWEEAKFGLAVSASPPETCPRRAGCWGFGRTGGQARLTGSAPVAAGRWPTRGSVPGEGRALPPSGPRPLLRLPWQRLGASQISHRVCVGPLSRTEAPPEVWVPSWRALLLRTIAPLRLPALTRRMAGVRGDFGVVWLSSDVVTTEEARETQKFRLLFPLLLKIPLINSGQ